MSEQVQGVADAAQAGYFRVQLLHERSGLTSVLAKLTKSLTRCMTDGDVRPISDIRRHIRTVERELQLIDRMVEALDDRFSDDPAATADAEPVRCRA